jgi:hypothetical protein
MDDELRAHLEAMEGRIMAKINDGQERIVNRLSALERDFTNTKGFLVEDSIVSSRRWLDMDDRMTKIERGEKP